MQTLDFLEDWIAKNSLPKYRAKQIYQAVTKNLISNWKEAIELPRGWENTLEKELPISNLEVKTIIPDSRYNSGVVPTNADTVKIAFSTHDDLTIESVLMRHLSTRPEQATRNTVCVSTQVGCPMNCAFCATGKMGFTRNLTAEEIVDQVLEFARILKQRAEKVTNIVFMGMGEPFLNYENVMGAIKTLNDNQGFNLGHRHMTISTSGIVPEILKFADEKIQVNLAVSLHAPNNKIRDSIMPVNKKYPLEKLLPAVSSYMQKTNRKVFFEYILLEGINDSDENIIELIDLMRKNFANQMQLVHINLIEYNEIAPVGTGFTPAHKKGQPQGLPLQLGSPDHRKTKHIADLLQRNKVLTTIRYRFGDDISAACGQLAGSI